MPRTQQYLHHLISVQRKCAQFRKYMYTPLKSPSPKCDNDGNTVTALDCLLLPPLSSLVFYESRSTGRPRRCVNDWRKAEPRVTLQTFPIRWPPLPSLPSTAMAPILLMMTQMMVLPQDLLNLALLGIYLDNILSRKFHRKFEFRQRLVNVLSY